MFTLQCVLFVCLALAPLLFGSSAVVVVTDSLIFMTYAASLYFVVGTGGILSFGHAAFFGAGAYAAALLTKYAHWPMLAALLAAPVASGLLAAAFGRFCIRLEGIYRAMLTLALAQILWSVVFQWQDVTGGDSGLLGIWPAAWVASPMAYLYVVLPVAAAFIFLLTRIADAPFGYALRGARDSATRAGAIGIDVGRVQWLGFVVGGAVAGLAGGFYAFARGSVFPDMISIDLSVEGLVMIVVGGLTNGFGPLIGAVVYHGMITEVIRLTEYWRTLAGLFIICLSIGISINWAGVFRSRRLGAAR